MDLLVRVLIAVAAFAVTVAVLTKWPRVLLARGPVPVAALCVAAATGAILAQGAPTALSGIDGAMRAALAAAVTAASARARRQIWLFASTATVVAGAGAAYDWLAFVATGATLAMVVLGRRSWVVGAVIGACVSQVLLRLDLGGSTGTSSVVAAAVAGTLLVSGLRHARRSTRRRAWISAGVLAGAGVVFSGAGALSAAGAVGDVRTGIDAGRDGLAAARRGETGEATRRFDNASDDFGRAGAGLGRWWVRPALAVPLVGQHLRAAQTLSAAGKELAGAASSAASEVDLKGLRLSQGAVDLAAVERASGALASARRALDRAAKNVEAVRSPWLVAPLVKAIGDLDLRMGEARRDVGTASDVLALAGPMLGRDGPRRWFLAVVTPAENRGSGGLVGNTAEITAQAGRLDLAAVQRIVQLNEAVDDAAAARVLPPLYTEVYGDWKVPARLQNVTVAADFPTTAVGLESVLPLAGRGIVDGVISVDPLAVAALLKAVGPVTVPGWPVPISAENAASVLLHEQYVALGGETRENFLGGVIQAVWARVISGSLPSPAALARALGPAVRGRHLQFHSRRAEEQEILGRLGADGAVRVAGGDHLRLVTDNASQSKIDWFLRRALDYHLHYDPGTGKAKATVKVTLANDAPGSGLPAYVLGGQVVPPGFSRQIVQIYSPFDLVAATVDGKPAADTGSRSLGHPGNWAHELDVSVPPKSTMTLELQLEGQLATSPRRWTLDVGRQAAVRTDDVTIRVDVADGWSITSTSGGLTGGGANTAAHLDLDADVHLGAEMRRR